MLLLAILQRCIQRELCRGGHKACRTRKCPASGFKLFVKWLYTQDIAEEEMDLLNGDNTNLVDAWILADRFIVPQLQNQLLWSMSSRRGKVSFESFIRAYEKTAPGSKLCSYIIDRMTYDIITNPDHRPIEEGFSKRFPREMLDDLFYGFLVPVPAKTRFLSHPAEHYQVKE
jgi:hypothetical protein